MTGASSATSASGTRSSVVSKPANIGSPSSTTSSPPSTIPNLMTSLWLKRAILTGSAYSAVQTDQPAVTVVAAAVLDVGQLLTQRQRQLTRGLLVEEVLALQHADRRDDRRRAAGEHLDDVAGCDIPPPVLERDRAALHRVPAVGREL